MMHRITLSLFVIFSLAACSTTKLDTETAPLVLKPSSFADLPGWESDNHEQALVAFSRSCDRILKKDPNQSFGPDGIGGLYGDWQAACKNLPVTNANRFFETYFRPYQATAADKNKDGLFTGYYEPALNGSRTRHGPYQTPLHKRPDDLVMVDLGEFRDELKGQRIAGRVKGAHLKPYEDREDIIEGQWPHNDETLIWVDDSVGAFFLHIQGSGRINMDDGTVMRVGYDGQNGHPYYAIGRELIKRGELDKDTVSLQTIRQWLETHPDQADNLMNTNASYVFFKELTGPGPLGGEGVPLTPERSLAVDRSKMPYGVPVWVSLDAPRRWGTPHPPPDGGTGYRRGDPRPRARRCILGCW